jgi:hypothetical protein
MYLERLPPTKDDDSYDLVCLKKDEALGLITFMSSLILFILIHRTKDNKSVMET